MTDLATALTSALLDFIWQGVLFACLLWIALIVLRKNSPQVRYLVSCGTLLIMMVVPVITVCRVYQPGTSTIAMSTAQVVREVSAMASPPNTTPWLLWIQTFALPVWSAGVMLFSLRLIWGCTQISTIKRRGIPANEQLRSIVERLASRMGLSRTIRLLTSARADSPSVVGVLRPVILLPVSSLTGLTPQQLEAILAHELAHIRRYDPLVNTLQILIETLLFYHPAIWWVSARIRHERELCCDDLALRSCGDALCYARALTALEKLRGPGVPLAIGCTDGPLLYRIRRVMGVRTGDYSPSKASGILALLLAIACLAVNPTMRIKAQSSPAFYTNVGVRADVGDAEVVEPIRYPAAALEKAVQGTVVVQLDVDAQGSVTDARVLSGPPELRKAVLRPVLTWRFKKKGTTIPLDPHNGEILASRSTDGIPSTRQINVDFHVPSTEELQSVRETVGEMPDNVVLEAKRAAVKAQLDRLQQAETSVHDRTRQSELEAKLAREQELSTRAAMDAAAKEQRLAEKDQQKLTVEQKVQSLESQLLQLENLQESFGSQTQNLQRMQSAIAAQLEELRSQASKVDSAMRSPIAMAGRVLARIDVTGLSTEQRDRLIKQLPVKVGDTLSQQTIEDLGHVLRAFDTHLRFELVPIEEGRVLLEIAQPNERIERQTELNRQIRATEKQIAVASKSLSERHPDMLELVSRLRQLQRYQAVELMQADGPPIK